MTTRAVRDGVLTQVEERLTSLVDATVEEIYQQVEAYARSHHPALREGLRVHVDNLFRTVVRCLREGRESRPEDFPDTKTQAARRLEAGIELHEFLEAVRISQRCIWHSVLDAVPATRAAREVALEMVDDIVQVVEVARSLATESYLQAQQYAFVDQDRRVRDLMEDLLRREHLVDPRKLSMLRSAGLLDGTPFVVLSALRVPHHDSVADRPGLSAVRVARARGVVGFAASRNDEIFGVMAVGSGPAAKALDRLRRTMSDLARTDAPYSTGVSTTLTDLARVPVGYAEATQARNSLGGAAGLVSLTEMKPFDYLVLRDDETAQRVVRPEVWQFLQDDRAGGSTLTRTLEEYVACDLNAITTAQRLHLHVNTVYYRLSRVAERTGTDMRSVLNVVDLLIAIRLHRARNLPSTSLG